MLRASLVALALSVPLAVQADPCRDEIAGLFDAGPLDPFVRPNRRETVIIVHPDGTETPMNEALWDGTTKSINHVNGMYYLSVGTKAWQGPSVDGPWTFTGSMGDFDPDELSRLMRDSMAANLEDTACGGIVDLEGRPARKYSFRTETDANQFGAWWGGLYTAYIDVESGQLARMERAEGVASWAPQPAEIVEVTTVVYDDGISISVPAE